MNGWDFRVRGFPTPNYAREIGAPYNEALSETVHKGESSAAIEVEVWQERMRKGQVSKVEIIDMRPGGGLTNLHVFEHTRILWSWMKQSA